MLMLDAKRLGREVAAYHVYRLFGRLKSATGLLWSCTLPATVGEQYLVHAPQGSIRAEAIGFARDVSYLIPYETISEVHAGMPVERLHGALQAPVGKGILGRVLDGIGRPLDAAGPLAPCPHRRVRLEAPPAMRRHRITRPFIKIGRAHV